MVLIGADVVLTWCCTGGEWTQAKEKYPPADNKFVAPHVGVSCGIHPDSPLTCQNNMIT